ncbi:Uncharacterized protein APZ42_000141 [Daphnia magna]|uniref:Uncharacterized protein n=1 Tax=Daphnia magna TaxID=35525 RepID=A0A164JW06_9CRUS|nr:Uncharacterized protein APZ42_000141 [Daphnia magna]
MRSVWVRGRHVPSCEGDVADGYGQPAVTGEIFTAVRRAGGPDRLGKDGDRRIPTACRETVSLTTSHGLLFLRRGLCSKWKIWQRESRRQMGTHTFSYLINPDVSFPPLIKCCSEWNVGG